MTFCVNAAAESLKIVTADLTSKLVAQTEMDTLQKTLASTSVDQVLTDGLHEFIDIFQYNLNVVDEAIYRSFFALQES